MQLYRYTTERRKIAYVQTWVLFEIQDTYLLLDILFSEVSCISANSFFDQVSKQSKRYLVSQSFFKMYQDIVSAISKIPEYLVSVSRSSYMRYLLSFI